MSSKVHQYRVSCVYISICDAVKNQWKYLSGKCTECTSCLAGLGYYSLTMMVSHSMSLDLVQEVQGSFNEEKEKKRFPIQTEEGQLWTSSSPVYGQILKEKEKAELWFRPEGWIFKK